MQQKPFTKRCIDFLGSKLFFAIVVAIFFLEAAWIALTARYPQAFDEQFHLGIIQLYAHQWSPFFAHQPAGADQFGALTRDPSYLYHYLMSFPWRLITHITGSFTAQIIILRFLNILLLGSSLFIFKKLLHLVPASYALVNTTLFLFVLTPVVPLLASQINYDNMLVPLSGLSVLWCVQLVQRIRQDHVVPFGLATRLLVLALLASLVKYAFLPIFAAIVLIILVVLWQEVRGKSLKLMPVLKTAWRAAGKWWLLAGVAAVLIGGGLFVERYGVNMLRYHTPVPDCGQVLSVTQCRSYAPWGRNYSISQYKTTPPWWQVAGYTFDWLYHDMGELIFTIGSSFNTTGTVNYYVGTQTVAIEVLAWSVFGIGLVLGVCYAKQIWHNPVLRLFLVVIALYALALWVQNYRDYVRLGQPIAIHGRYLLPVLPLIYLIVALSFRTALQTVRVPHVSLAARKAVLALFVFAVLLTQGGGAATFIIRNDSRWLWAGNSAAQNANDKAKKVLKPLILDNHQS